MKSKTCLSLLLFLVLTIAQTAFAKSEPHTIDTIEAPSCLYSSSTLITWSPSEITCPVCQTKNIFMVWNSYGSYIYQYPSKYQLVFWPYTDSQSWYSCKHCRYSAFMGDFASVPKEKLDEIREALKSVTLPPQRSDSANGLPPYLDLSVSARMLVAEKIYRIVHGDSAEFWAHFYRVLGYTLGSESKTAEAAEARQKVLKIVDAWLQDKTKQGERKEFLYISGAMYHFLKDDQAASAAFDEAAKLKYSNPKLEPDRNKGYDEYLSALIKEYQSMLKKGAGPKEEV